MYLGSNDLPLFTLLFAGFIEFILFSLVSAINLISPVITRMLSSNGELSNRQQCFPNRIISFRKNWDVRYYCWASGCLWLQHWTGLGLPVCTVWCSCFSVWPPHFHLRKLLTVCLTAHCLRDSSKSSLCLFGWMTGHGGNVSELIILLGSNHLTYTSLAK